MPFFSIWKKRLSLLFLVIFSILLFAACGENTPTIPPTATAGIEATLTPAGVEPTAPAVIPASPTTTVSDIDPNVAYTPGTVIAATVGNTPTPRNLTPTITANYGNLPTPPRTLVPQTTPASGPVAKGNFVVATSNGLFVLSADGQGERTLAAGAAFSGPKISPDGTRIAVFKVDPISLKQQLYIINDKGESKALSGDGGTILHFAWSPDGKSLALTRTVDANDDGIVDFNDKSNIWLYDVNSGKQQQVAEGRSAAWSPDGVRIAFVIPGPPPAASDLDPTTRKLRVSSNAIGVYNIQQNAKRTLVPSKGVEFPLGEAVEDANLKKSNVSLRYFKEVSWHPDSKHITVSADATGPNNLRLGVALALTVDEPTPRLLTSGGDAARKLVWSPDGKRLVFETEGQYPLKPKSGESLGVLDQASFTAASPTKNFIGDPSVRNFTRQPLWLNNGQQIGYLKGDSNILSVSDPDGKNERVLISGCTGFDWF